MKAGSACVLSTSLSRLMAGPVSQRSHWAQAISNLASMAPVQKAAEMLGWAETPQHPSVLENSHKTFQGSGTHQGRLLSSLLSIISLPVEEIMTSVPRLVFLTPVM